MKRLLVVFLLLVLIVSISVAQKAERKNLFGLNPIGLIFGIYSGEYGRYLDGKSELNIPFFYWKPLDELSFIGIGGRYRLYKDDNNEGILYGGGVSLLIVSWKYKTTTLVGWTPTTKTEDISTVIVNPYIEAGYRWRWDSGFTLAPTLSLGYYIGSIKSSTGEEASYGSGGVSWGLGLGLAYEF